MSNMDFSDLMPTVSLVAVISGVSEETQTCSIGS